jgi:hypothetical protein
MAISNNGVYRELESRRRTARLRGLLNTGTMYLLFCTESAVFCHPEGISMLGRRWTCAAVAGSEKITDRGDGTQEDECEGETKVNCHVAIEAKIRALKALLMIDIIFFTLKVWHGHEHEHNGHEQQRDAGVIGTGMNVRFMNAWAGMNSQTWA